VELKLKNGDYIPDGFGGFVRCTETENMLAKALYLLTAKRGAFPLLPKLGSRLHLLGKEIPSARNMVALQYANEALEGLDIQAVDAVVALVDSHNGTVAITLEYADELLSLEVTI